MHGYSALQRSPQSAAELVYPQVRLATVADVTRMAQLINAAFALETFLDGTRTNEDQLAGMMTGGAFLLGHDARGELVASVYVQAQGACGSLGMLAVSPAHQNRGFGRAMMDAAEDYCRARGSKAMDLRVLSLRPELAPFYAKCGYRETAREEFRPPRALRAGLECHSIVMSKQL